MDTLGAEDENVVLADMVDFTLQLQNSRPYRLPHRLSRRGTGMVRIAEMLRRRDREQGI